METILRSLFGVFLIAAFAYPTDGLSCYGCDSVTNAGCSDPFGDASIEQDCIQCSKFKYKKGSVEVVLRGCEQGVFANNGCASQTKNGASGELCLCQTDQCNAASTPLAALTSLLIAIALAAKNIFIN